METVRERWTDERLEAMNHAICGSRAGWSPPCSGWSRPGSGWTSFRS